MNEGVRSIGWNDTDREKPTHCDQILSYSHFAQHKSHILWPGIETRPPW